MVTFELGAIIVSAVGLLIAASGFLVKRVLDQYDEGQEKILARLDVIRGDVTGLAIRMEGRLTRLETLVEVKSVAASILEGAKKNAA